MGQDYRSSGVKASGASAAAGFGRCDGRCPNTKWSVEQKQSMLVILAAGHVARDVVFVVAMGTNGNYFFMVGQHNAHCP